MPQEVLNWILGIATTIVTALISFGVARLTVWFNKRCKNKEEAKLLTEILNIVAEAVKYVFQVFVEALKKEGKFNEKAQKEAKEKALDYIQNHLTAKMRDFITENYGDIKAWLSSQIETCIYNLKQ